MKNYLVQPTLVACIVSLLSIPASAQSVQTHGLKGQASTRDSHIKRNDITNSEDQKFVAPVRKGGPEAKGPYGTCILHIDNHTGYYVTFYLNGTPQGVIGPWGDLYPDITEGFAELYARATFDNGGVLTFGPHDYRCSGGDFVWTLTP